MAAKSAIKTRLWIIGIPLVAAGLFAVVTYQATAPVPDQLTTAGVPVRPLPHPIIILEPQTTPSVDTGLVDDMGQPITANCTTCHATREPNPAINDGDQLADFHTGLHTDHGGLTCLSCHNADDYSTLAKADGRALDFQKQIQLCAQCHGPQHRDYVNGSHGGMSGYWDLSRGTRTRNTCTDCHDAHAPQYPVVMPVFKPRDRFLNPPIEHHAPSAGLTGASSENEAGHE